MRERVTWPQIAALVLAGFSALGILIAAVGWQLRPTNDRIGAIDADLIQIREELHSIHMDLADLAGLKPMMAMVCRRLQCGVPVVEGQDQ